MTESGDQTVESSDTPTFRQKVDTLADTVHPESNLLVLAYDLADELDERDRTARNGEEEWDASSMFERWEVEQQPICEKNGCFDFEIVGHDGTCMEQAFNGGFRAALAETLRSIAEPKLEPIQIAGMYYHVIGACPWCGDTLILDRGHHSGKSRGRGNSKLAVWHRTNASAWCEKDRKRFADEDARRVLAADQQETKS